MYGNAKEMKMKKQHIIINIFFTVLLLYLIAPWFFEKQFFFNELLSAFGCATLIYKRRSIPTDNISLAIIFLLLLGGVHAITSLFRMDELYYYLRNTVIVYSIFGYFAGYFTWRYLFPYIEKIRLPLAAYSVTGIALRAPKLLVERFGMSALFPVLFYDVAGKYILPLLIASNVVYAIAYDSSTTMILSAFYLFVWIVPGYRFFVIAVVAGLIVFSIFFWKMIPNLSLISQHYNHFNERGIRSVVNSNRILAIDPNSTWRLILWKQSIVDKFPENIPGIGFGTPMYKYYPIEDHRKIPQLPYVMGAHNSFVYVFARLGIGFVAAIGIIYHEVMRSYFRMKRYAGERKELLLFYSFFAVTFIAVFNPALESPIYAVGYWTILGLLSAAIQHVKKEIPEFHESPVYT
jgi:hypothetical protein